MPAKILIILAIILAGCLLLGVLTYCKIRSYEITPELEKIWTEEKKKWDNFAEKRAVRMTSKNSKRNVKISEASELKPIPLRSSSPNFNEALRVSIQSALVKDHVIPEVKVTNFPKEYVLPKINIGMLLSRDFNIERLDDIFDNDTSNIKNIKDIQTFINLLYSTVQNRLVSGETNNNSLVNNLLQISKLDTLPFNKKTRIRSSCKLFDGGNLYESLYPKLPELIVDYNKRKAMIVMNEYPYNFDKNISEIRIAAEIFSCGNETRRRTFKNSEQIIFAVRFISTYVTFYKAVISTEYWKELDNGLPLDQSILIKRWPQKNGLRTGLDITDPNERQEVLLALDKIRQFILQDASYSR
ncbi:hypothetical protein RhiirC2_715132 [Rhizophagus irregularis]|uniref:Uncharacterized protein n=1 Tax=Rhizophagus irregularis TaxID=588596 RepID=A0A2N1MWP1_9GLOM|nr:hypothetical protein RhiirC2_715132 [Rhizophagus irregularis]